MRVFESAGRQITLRINGKQTRIGSFPVGIEPRAFQRLARRNVRSPLVKDLVASLGEPRADDRRRPSGLFQRDLSSVSMPSTTFLQAIPTGSARSRICRSRRKTARPFRNMPIWNRPPTPRPAGSTANMARYRGRRSATSTASTAASALAGLYRTARVGLVTPLRDGMNLVAKEYVAAQDPDDPGVLVLSRFAGAAIDLRRALLVNPYDAGIGGGRHRASARHAA